MKAQMVLIAAMAAILVTGCSSLGDQGDPYFGEPPQLYDTKIQQYLIGSESGSADRIYEIGDLFKAAVYSPNLLGQKRLIWAGYASDVYSKGRDVENVSQRYIVMFQAGRVKYVCEPPPGVRDCGEGFNRYEASNNRPVATSVTDSTPALYGSVKEQMSFDGQDLTADESAGDSLPVMTEGSARDYALSTTSDSETPFNQKTSEIDTRLPPHENSHPARQLIQSGCDFIDVSVTVSGDEQWRLLCNGRSTSVRFTPL